VERLSPEQEDQLRENWGRGCRIKEGKEILRKMEKWAKQVDLKNLILQLNWLNRRAE